VLCYVNIAINDILLILWTTFFDGQFRSIIFNHFDVIGLKSYQIRWNNAKEGSLCHSRSSIGSSYASAAFY